MTNIKSTTNEEWARAEIAAIRENIDELKIERHEAFERHDMRSVNELNRDIAELNRAIYALRAYTEC